MQTLCTKAFAKILFFFFSLSFDEKLSIVVWRKASFLAHEIQNIWLPVMNLMIILFSLFVYYYEIQLSAHICVRKQRVTTLVKYICILASAVRVLW